MARSKAATQAFKLYGPTCDSLDAMEGPFVLPADIREGDYIEIGMLGAYGVAMQTRFNGFGETEDHRRPRPAVDLDVRPARGREACPPRRPQADAPPQGRAVDKL